MNDMNYTFDPNAVQDDGGGFDGELLPNGDYTFIGTGVEAKETSAGNGSWYFEFVLEVIEGQHKGRKVWHKFNMQNQSEKAMEISHREYKRLHDAVGKGPTQSPQELLNIPFRATVGVEKGTNGYADKSVIKKFAAKGSVPAASAPPQQAPQAQQATPAQATQHAAAKMPWE